MKDQFDMWHLRFDIGLFPFPDKVDDLNFREFSTRSGSISNSK